VTLLLGAAVVGFVIAVAGYEVFVLGPVRREIAKSRRDFDAIRPLVSATPIRSDLTDSTPSLPL
jgi:hypothetical protein